MKFFFSPETIKVHVPSSAIECRSSQPEIMFSGHGYSYLAQNQQSLIPLRVRAVSHQHWQALRPRFHSLKYRKKHRNPSNREEDLESKFLKKTLLRSTVSELRVWEQSSAIQHLLAHRRHWVQDAKVVPVAAEVIKAFVKPKEANPFVFRSKSSAHSADFWHPCPAQEECVCRSMAKTSSECQSSRLTL